MVQRTDVAVAREGEHIPAVNKYGPKKCPEIVDEMLEGIACGQSAKQMCKIVNITERTFWLWLQKDKDFADAYVLAKKLSAQVYAEQLIEIADEKPQPIFDVEDGRIVGFEDAGIFSARQRLRVDTRKWVMGKHDPKKYGEKIDHNVRGGIVIVPATKLDEDL